MASLAARLAAGEPVGNADTEGYLPRGLRVNVLSDRTGARRAIDMLLAKLAGDVRTEVEPRGDRVPPPSPVADLASIRIALVTEAGCVPQGNPDRLPTRHANVWLRYPIVGVDSLDADAYESVHAGFDTSFANGDPNRLVPLDAPTPSGPCTTCSTRRVGWIPPSRWPHVTGRRSPPICAGPRSGR
jgi:betaine reductase